MPEFDRIQDLVYTIGLGIAGVMLLLIGVKATWESRSGRGGSSIGESLGIWLVGVVILLLGTGFFTFIVSRLGG